MGILSWPRPQSVNSVGRVLIKERSATRSDGTCNTCHLARRVLVATGEQNIPIPEKSSRKKSSKAPIMDGAKLLIELVRQAGYDSLESAIASHTIFIHPETVYQTRGQAILPMIRGNVRKGIHKYETQPDGSQVWIDNNIPVKNLFLWATNRKKGIDFQCNHIWNTSNDPEAYTALWNLCVTPAFLAKATDSKGPVKALLQYRSFDLYGHLPKGHPKPQRPQGYEKLSWSDFPEPLPNLESHLRSIMTGKPKSAATRIARELGWLFSNWAPDRSFPAE